ncbi:MAG: PilZ domain-containing protein [Nitrospirae bacterium]|nr:PilZ domain-containing protein [Nitrospirota bacterium]
MFRERRKYARDVVFIPLKIHLLGNGTKVASTINYSYGGALIGNPFEETLEAGTELTLQLADLIEGNEAPKLPARVTRASADEIAVQLLIDYSETE